MSAEAIVKLPRDEYQITAAAAVASGEVWQMPDGRAAVYKGQNAAASGDLTGWCATGKATVTKAANLVWIKGDPIWWDHSANAATPNEPIGAGDRDFYLGTAVEDATAAATTGEVDLNVQPSWIIDSTRDVGTTLVVLTSGTPTLVSRGGLLNATFSATAEAQKLDWLSGRSFTLASNWVLEALVLLVTTCDADVGDVSIGVANATHASDADSITESAFFHLDLGADLNIDAESDDGTTEVAATDTTIDIVAGTPIRLKLDGRDPSNVKYYINGAEVLSATSNLGNIAAATGPLFALFHFEKSSNDSPGEIGCRLRVRTMQQD
jgi:hypothetical protein